MKILFKHANILDGTKDMVLKEDYDLLVEDEKIVKIAKEITDKSDKVHDLKGKYIIPGLINLHVHLPATGFPKKVQTDPKKLAGLIRSNPIGLKIGEKITESGVKTELRSGVTTLRSVGGVADCDVRVKRNVESGKTLGPRMVVCNEALTIPGGHMEGSVAYGAETDEQFVKFIKRSKTQGNDWLKIMITGGVLDAKKKGEPGDMKMTPEQVKLCCDTAHHMGLKVCAHVESSKGVDVALKNGVDSIEHGSDVSGNDIKLFKKTGAVVVCTISPAIPLAHFDRQLTGATDVTEYNSLVLQENMIKGYKKLLKAGVKIGLGTDVGCPFITHYDTWRELEYYHIFCEVDRKFSLYSATLNNAEILGLEKETGSLEVGKSADFVVVEKNPLDGFSTLRNPLAVSMKGKLLIRPKNKKNEIAEKALDEYYVSIGGK